MPSLKPVKRKDFEKFLEYIGCVKVRIKGDHIIYKRPGLSRPIVIVADSELSTFIIRNNLRTLGISVKEFYEILERI